MVKNLIMPIVGFLTKGIDIAKLNYTPRKIDCLDVDCLDVDCFDVDCFEGLPNAESFGLAACVWSGRYCFLAWVPYKGNRQLSVRR